MNDTGHLVYDKFDWMLYAVPLALPSLFVFVCDILWIVTLPGGLLSTIGHVTLHNYLATSFGMLSVDG